MITENSRFIMKFYQDGEEEERKNVGIPAIAKFIDENFDDVEDIQIFRIAKTRDGNIKLNCTCDALELCAAYWEEKGEYAKVISPFIYSLSLPNKIMTRIRQKQQAIQLAGWRRNYHGVSV